MTQTTNTEKCSYERPALEMVGKLHLLTEAQDKTWGYSDGFTFQGVSITNVS